jgi:hypothetical protein
LGKYPKESSIERIGSDKQRLLRQKQSKAWIEPVTRLMNGFPPVGATALIGVGGQALAQYYPPHQAYLRQPLPPAVNAEGVLGAIAQFAPPELGRRPGFQL